MKYYITCVQKQVSPYGIYEDEERLRELVVCKDCKYHNEYSECEIWELYQTADTDYCSNGEKK